MYLLNIWRVLWPVIAATSIQKAAEELEDEMTGPVYYLARGLLRLAESFAVQADKGKNTTNKWFSADIHVLNPNRRPITERR